VRSNDFRSSRRRGAFIKVLLTLVLGCRGWLMFWLKSCNMIENAWFIDQQWLRDRLVNTLTVQAYRNSNLNCIALQWCRELVVPDDWYQFLVPVSVACVAGLNRHPSLTKIPLQNTNRKLKIKKTLRSYFKPTYMLVDIMTSQQIQDGVWFLFWNVNLP